MREHALGAKTGIDGEQAVQALHHQSGADQENERQRHLGDDQKIAPAILMRAATGGSRAFLQIRLQVGLRGVQRGRQAKHQCGQGHDPGGE